MDMKNRVSIDEVAKGFDRSIEALDEIRAMQLGERMRVQSAKDHVYAREHDRLERKYGKDHPRTTAMAEKMQINRDHIQGISVVHTTAATPRPAAGKGWAVDGFVRTADGVPVPGVTVAAYDKDDTWYEKFGFSCTDDKGYFSLVAANFSDRLPAPALMQVSKGKKIQPSNAPQVVPTPGSTDRVEIILGGNAEKGECAPPSGGKTPPKDTPPDKPKPVEPKPVEPKPVEAGVHATGSVERPEKGVKATGSVEKPAPKVEPKPEAEAGVKATGSVEKPAPKKRRKE